MSSHNERDNDAQIEREARQSRTFSIGDRISREGSGMFRGASPVPRLKQVRTELSQFVAAHTPDHSGALRAVLIRHINTSDALLGEHFDAPLVGLGVLLDGLTKSEARYHDFVQEVDIEWGRMMAARPYFQEPGEPPHEDDEYTHESVKKDLGTLRSLVAEQV